MRVVVNGRTVTLFAGAVVRDAVHTWAGEEGKHLSGWIARDENGFEVAPDGPLEEGMRLSVTHS
ncbi:hypothetical protein [uncultured Porphyromonas sp.]|uniref:hypothetical protein n=1 Tax=uncultured Porphyromonas sp. TaxID=159274 RepID=UPI002602B1D4|nr:hypothetical protein [uncultured Porphyromonas sp.]